MGVGVRGLKNAERILAVLQTHKIIPFHALILRYNVMFLDKSLEPACDVLFALAEALFHFCHVSRRRVLGEIPSELSEFLIEVVAPCKSAISGPGLGEYFHLVCTKRGGRIQIQSHLALRVNLISPLRSPFKTAPVGGKSMHKKIETPNKQEVNHKAQVPLRTARRGSSATMIRL